MRMSTMNDQYAENVRIVQWGKNADEIERAMNRLLHIRDELVAHHPEYLDGITDIDFYVACAAYRINNVQQFEQMVQRHYYDDARFKRLYRSHLEVETTNVWRNIVRENANNMEKTFVRSLSIIILTGICVSIIMRK